jgi:hypothetical protein
MSTDITTVVDVCACCRFPAQIGGTFYICVWVRIPSLSMHYDVNDLHVVGPPIFGSHKGEYMVNVTS